ncbi:FEN-1 [Aratus pisonii nudivirus]|nr:FEN-1 [Aratus pisonii nudivirus]
MGISEFREIKKEFIEMDPLTDLKILTSNTPVDIYIDGSFYLYTGLIDKNLNSDGVTYNCEMAADTVCVLIYNIINKIKKLKIIIGDVYVFFDGVKPKSKQKTMQIRNDKKQNKDELFKIKNLIIKMFNDQKYVMCNLVLGEAEHDMFTFRNTIRPSIMLTDDSDVFHIAYNYNSRTFNDYTFIATKHLNFTCNLQNLVKKLNNVPKLIFVLLCALKGSDFTCHTFTTSMFKVILSEFKNPSCGRTRKIIENLKDLANYQDKELKISNELGKLNSVVYNHLDEESEYVTIDGIYQMDVVCLCIKGLLKILIETEYKFNWNQKCVQIDNETYHYETIFDQLKAITWTVNYSLIGSRYSNYFSNINFPTDLDKYKFYFFILEYEGGDVYSKLTQTKFMNVDRTLFLNIKDVISF